MKHTELIHQSIYYIEHNLFEEIRLTDLASKAHLSMYHFHRIFLANVE
ncbi:helix-turn-helix transcriptional regulator [Paenibacillus alkalitolerans]|nr:helix-turn-helix transcriptional regulator [Paenibacillus alkalitolerans]